MYYNKRRPQTQRGDDEKNVPAPAGGGNAAARGHFSAVTQASLCRTRRAALPWGGGSAAGMRAAHSVTVTVYRSACPAASTGAGSGVRVQRPGAHRQPGRDFVLGHRAAGVADGIAQRTGGVVAPSGIIPARPSGGLIM